MCGIYGIVAIRPGARVEPSDLAAMAGTQFHRGPDDEGAYVGERVALGMRRLSIIDLATGQQPIWNQDRTAVVVCNGELYNYRSVTERLVAAGHKFRTRSDVEILVHLYDERGLDLLDEVEGMFGFALWDETRDRFLLGRDRLGVKPLYYMEHEGRLIFASEIKAILTLVGGFSEPDPLALKEYLSFGYTPNDRSLFPGIKKLPPASLLVLQGGEIKVSSYWSPPKAIDEGLSEADWVGRIRDDLEAAVESEMVSDVPLGAFLSGGLDSSAVVAAMAKRSDEPIRTYSIGFDTGKAGSYYNELPYAKAVAERFGTRHKEILVRPEVAELLPRLLWHMDEPVADSALITTFLVAEFARQDVKVILSGVGGDEIFGGYRRYLGEFYGLLYARLPAWLRSNLVAPAARWLPSDRHSPLMNLSRQARVFLESHERPFEERYRAYVQVFGREAAEALAQRLPQGGADSFDDAFATADGADALQRLMQVDLLTQLPNDLLMLTDKMTMASSIECRVPLLNHRLVETCSQIPAALRIRKGRLKNLLKLALRETLPRDILERPKRGFGAPMGAWLKEELAPLAEELLSREAVERRGWFDWSRIESLLAQHRASRADHTDHLICLINLEVWARLFLDGRSSTDLSDELAKLAA